MEWIEALCCGQGEGSNTPISPTRRQTLLRDGEERESGHRLNGGPLVGKDIHVGLNLR